MKTIGALTAVSVRCLRALLSYYYCWRFVVVERLYVGSAGDTLGTPFPARPLGVPAVHNFLLLPEEAHACIRQLRGGGAHRRSRLVGSECLGGEAQLGR